MSVPDEYRYLLHCAKVISAKATYSLTRGEYCVPADRVLQLRNAIDGVVKKEMEANREKKDS